LSEKNKKKSIFELLNIRPNITGLISANFLYLSSVYFVIMSC